MSYKTDAVALKPVVRFRTPPCARPGEARGRPGRNGEHTWRKGSEPSFATVPTKTRCREGLQSVKCPFLVLC